MAYYPQPVVAAPIIVRERNVSGAHVAIAWVLCVLFSLSLLPWAIAATRDKRSTISIMLVNIFLGWTIIGWFWALIWACLEDPVDVVVAAPVVAAPMLTTAPYAPAYQPQYQLPAYQPSPYQPQYQPSPYQPGAGAPRPEPTLVLPPAPSQPYQNYGG